MVNIDLFGNIIHEIDDEIVKPKTASPFDFIKKFSDKKYPESVEGYNPWIINTALSMRKDSVIYANEMNRYAALSDLEQHDFFFHGLPKRNYFAKYAKASKDDNIKIICEFYKVSEVVAKQYSKVLSDSQVKELESLIMSRKGGKAQ